MFWAERLKMQNGAIFDYRSNVRTVQCWYYFGRMFREDLIEDINSSLFHKLVKCAESKSKVTDVKSSAKNVLTNNYAKVCVVRDWV